MKDKAYLYHIYCKVKDRIQRENKSYNQIKMCICMDCDGWNGNSFCMISLPTYKIFLKAWLSFFSFFSTLGPSCVHIFFDSPCFLFFFCFNNNWRERPTHTMEPYFVEWMDGTMLTSHRSIARGMWCAHESWSWKHEKNSLKGHNNLTKLNAKQAA